MIEEVKVLVKYSESGLIDNGHAMIAFRDKLYSYGAWRDGYLGPLPSEGSLLVVQGKELINAKLNELYKKEDAISVYTLRLDSTQVDKIEKGLKQGALSSTHSKESKDLLEYRYAKNSSLREYGLTEANNTCASIIYQALQKGVDSLPNTHVVSPQGLAEMLKDRPELAGYNYLDQNVDKSIHGTANWNVNVTTNFTSALGNSDKLVNDFVNNTNRQLQRQKYLDAISKINVGITPESEAKATASFEKKLKELRNQSGQMSKCEIGGAKQISVDKNYPLTSPLNDNAVEKFQKDVQISINNKAQTTPGSLTLA